MRDYEFSLSARSLRFFQRVSKRERDLLLRAFESLAFHPQQAPDGHLETYPRKILFRQFAGFRVSYWIDHAECDVRIVDIVLE